MHYDRNFVRPIMFLLYYLTLVEACSAIAAGVHSHVYLSAFLRVLYSDFWYQQSYLEPKFWNSIDNLTQPNSRYLMRLCASDRTANIVVHKPKEVTTFLSSFSIFLSIFTFFFVSFFYIFDIYLDVWFPSVHSID